MTTDALLETTPAVTVRAVFDYEQGRPFPLTDAIQKFAGFESLIYLASIDHWIGDEPYSGKFSPRDFMNSSCMVRTISYNSPLEIVVGLGVGFSTATLVANRLVGVWTNFQQARQITAKADLYVTAANVLQGTLHRPTIKPDDPLTARWSLAAQVLTELGSMDIEEK